MILNVSGQSGFDFRQNFKSDGDFRKTLSFCSNFIDNLKELSFFEKEILYHGAPPIKDENANPLNIDSAIRRPKVTTTRKGSKQLKKGGYTECKLNWNKIDLKIISFQRVEPKIVPSAYKIETK